MKNLYALNESVELIHIDKVDKQLKSKYKCCNCGNELIARKGKIKAHHFSHKSQVNCSFESYLHKVAKTKFFDHYKHSLKNKIPLKYYFSESRECDSCKNLGKFKRTCFLPEEIKSFDLTNHFDLISLEKKCNGFIPDILLESSKSNNKLFIEFAVTHHCEPEKIASGIRIIEFKISNESDLEIICRNEIYKDQRQTSIHNFVEYHYAGNFNDSSKCHSEMFIFYVFRNGKALLKSMPMSKIVKFMNSPDIIYMDSFSKPFSSIKGWDYISLIKEASNLKIPVKNCFACRFSVSNNKRDKKHSYFCKKKRSEIENSNMGSECENFWRILPD